MFQFGEEFLEHFTPNKMKGMYKKAVINALKVYLRISSNAESRFSYLIIMIGHPLFLSL